MYALTCQNRVRALKAFNLVTEIFLPRTKISNVGQSMFWAQQDNFTVHVEARQKNETFNSDGILKGHGLRIGGTLEYLLRGIPFDVVKFILAPYLQDSPALEPFTRYTMPPVY